MLELRGVRKVFRRNTVNETVALNGVNLTLAEGDFVTVIGSNGAGKSTLLNIVAGVFPPDEGEIVLRGRRIDGEPEYRRAAYVGRVFQDPLAGTAPGLSIEENLAMALLRGRRRGLRLAVREANRQLFRAALQQLGLGLERRLGERVGFLSGGERQAVTLVMATLNRPEVLLLDEHTAALDPKTAELVLGLTEMLVSLQNLTTLMVTHNMEQAIRLGNRLIMMDAGEVILDVRGEEKKRLTIQDLLQEFERVRGRRFSYDRGLLA